MAGTRVGFTLSLKPRCCVSFFLSFFHAETSATPLDSQSSSSTKPYRYHKNQLLHRSLIYVSRVKEVGARVSSLAGALFVDCPEIFQHNAHDVTSTIDRLLLLRR